LKNQIDNPYVFSAYALSLGAVLHEPSKAFLSDAPSAATPPTGGLISQSKESLSLKIESHEIIRCGRAHATVLGEDRGDHYLTMATCAVEKLNILDIITADAVVSRVTSVYPSPKKGGQDPARRQTTFYLAGSHFENLKINGTPIPCDIPKGSPHEIGFQIQTGTRERRSPFSGTCLHQIPQFGNIYLGEVYVYSSKVILTMIRVEFGCPNSGTTSVATASSNGTDDYGGSKK
jgi:hypothetical protein